MSIGQKKSGRAVVEDACRPSRDGVTVGALGRGGGESGGDVVGNIAAQRCGALESGLVTAIAVSRIQIVIIIYVARGTRRRSR